MTRVLIGPLNAAGQAAAWADALRRSGVDATSVSYRPRPRLRRSGRPDYDAPPDQRVPYPRLTTPLGRARRARRLVSGVSHVALDGFAPLLGPVGPGLADAELQRFTAWGKQLALVAHGSDVRDPDRHARDNPGSYFPLLPEEFRDRLATRSAQNRDLAERSGLPLFVSTPDLLVDLPTATWLPLCTDPSSWAVVRRWQPTRPRILHAPTSLLKGSDVIDEVLQELDRRGLVQYVRPAGVPHDQMPRLLGSVDVVVDQVRSGSYGMTAVEAMLSGAVTVAHLASDVRRRLPEDPGLHDAPPESFAAAMERLLDSRSQWPEIARRSHDFARRWHDGEASARALRGFVTPS